jgi:hypothetical protein
MAHFFATQKKPGYPLQVLARPRTAGLRAFRFYPLRAHGLTLFEKFNSRVV